MPNPSGFKGFLFDLDGTLLHTLPDLTVVANKALAEQGFPPRTQEEIFSFVGNGALMLMRDAVPEGSTQQQIERAFADFKRLHAIYGNKLTAPFEGVAELLPQLKERGKKLGVLSNKFEEGVQEVMRRYFPGLFDAAHGEREAQGIPRKPDPTGLVLLADELGLQPSSCVFFGDSAGDMRAAKAAGMFAVGVAWGYQSVERMQDAGADAIINHPDQALDFA